ncbi:MAG: M12 family metallo-peptidase [Verrucomicrobiae bacterium]|nr:M12 family metallo-peptidase [Verrucomicrobiae bacterium]
MRALAIATFLFLACAAFGQPAAPGPRQFPAGALRRLEDLPPGPFRARLESLPAAVRQRALDNLRGFHFTELDLRSLRADAKGDLFYEDHFPIPATAPASDDAPASEAGTAAQGSPAGGADESQSSPLPVSPFPASLIFHSRPGASNVIFLNFSGEIVTNTAWNNSLGRSVIPAVAFSTDSDHTTFSAAEQAAIKAIWRRVAEDFAPFNVDVTTERPPTMHSRVAHALITRNTDANGAANPSSTAGGVAYVNVFGLYSFANFRPAWIYCNNLSGNEAYIAEAVSHEVGHNLGLSHDGKTDGTEYYGGHGSGQISWGTIMGAAYNRNVTQWSRGEYHMANNTQDDLAVISAKLAFSPDDHGGSPLTATPLALTDATNILATTPETDPDNLNPANKGVLERNTDVDVFSFRTGAGQVKLTVSPSMMPSGTRGGNLDVRLELYDASGNLRASADPSGQTTAQIQTNLPAGDYFLWIRNSATGNPTNPSPSGYTAYGSLGQYFITGYVTLPTVQLTLAANAPERGTVSPAAGNFPLGATVELAATPATYFRFERWNGPFTATNNPLTLTLTNDLALTAEFAEIFTTNHPTPLWWLAAHGYTNDFENAVTRPGANGLPLWECWLAGLNPNDPNDRLRLTLTPVPGGDVLSWNTATGRLYSIWWSTNPWFGFVPLAGATNLPCTVRSFTNRLDPSSPAVFYRLSVTRP